jgi:transcriptional regulator with PAS, ATPase and Fis domain
VARGTAQNCQQGNWPDLPSKLLKHQYLLPQRPRTTRFSSLVQVALAIERKQKEKQIYKQSARLKAIFESSSHLIWSVDQNFNFTSYNQNYFRTNGDFYNIDPIDRTVNEDPLMTTFDRKFWQKKYKHAFEGKFPAL